MTGVTFAGSLPLHKELSEMMQELEAARSKLLHLRDHENTKARLSRINRYLAVLQTVFPEERIKIILQNQKIVVRKAYPSF